MDSPVSGQPSGTPEGAPAPRPAAEPAPTELSLRVRTAPKLWPFLGAGFLLAAIVALVVAWFSHEANVKAAAGDPVEFTFGSVFGFFLVIFGIIGLCAGALAFLVTDRIGRRREHTVRVVAQGLRDEDSTPNA